MEALTDGHGEVGVVISHGLLFRGVSKGKETGKND